MRKTVSAILVTLGGAMAWLALLGWFTGHWQWLSLGTGCVPTAPATSILLILLSAILLEEILGSGNAVLRLFCRTASVLITVAGLMALMRPFFGWPSPLEQWMAGTAQTIGNAPVGQISPLAGLAFLLAGSASWAKTFRFLNKKWSDRIELGFGGLVFWISAVVILSYMAGTPLFSDRPIIPMALWTAIIFFFLSIAMALRYEPVGSPAASVTSGGKKPLVHKPLWILASSLVVFAILAGGITYLRGEETRIRKEKSAELAAIGKLKIDQILRWRKERIADIARFSKATFLVKALEAWLHKPDDAALKKNIIRRLKLETQSGIYTQALLMDANAHVLLSFPETAEMIDEIRNVVKETRDRSGVFMSELHSGVPGEVDVDIIAAMHGVSDQLLAVAVLTSDAREYLFPILQVWPVPSHSAETLLVRRDGENALFLNDLKYRKNTAPTLRIPLTEIKVPAVQAILGKTGPVIGPDYRGVEVFADLRPVPGTSWYLVTKVDTAEALAEVRFRAIMTFAIICILVAGILGLIILLYQIRLMKEREAAAEHLRSSKQKLDLALKSARMGVWQFDLVKNKRFFDYKVCALLGIDPATFGGTTEEFLAAVHPEDRGKLREALTRTINDGIHYEPEYRVVWSDGSIHHITGRGELVFNDQGKPEMINGIIWDITDHKRMEDKLRESEERFRLANKVTNDVVWDWDVITDTQKWNEAAAVIFGWTDIVERPQSAHWWVERVHPEDTQRVSDGFFAAVNNPEADYWRDEYRFRKADGSYAQVMDRGYVLRDKHGKALRMIGAMLDITARKKAEEMLQESEALYRKLFENSWDAMMILDPPSWRFVSGNPSMLRMFGAKDKKELLLHFPWTLSPDRQPDGRMSEEKSKAMIEIAVRTGHHFFEWVHKRFDGDIFPAEVLLTRTEKQGKLSLQASVRDITERKKAEEALRQAEERYRELVEGTDDLITVVNGEGRFVFVNHSAEKFFGIKPEDCKGLLAFDFIHPEDRERTKKAFEGWVRGKKNQTTYQNRQVNKNGQVFEMLWNINVHFNDSGKVEEIISFARDITEHKKAEEALRESEAHYRSLFSNMINGFAYCRMLFEQGQPQDFIYLVVNDAFKNLTGLKDVANKKASEVIPGLREADPGLLAIYGRVARTGVPERVEVYVKALKEWLDIAVYSPRQDHFVVAFEVITHRKETEEKIKKLNLELEERVKERTAELAMMVKELEAFDYSVAHDLKAPLRAMTGFANILSEDYAPKLDENAKRVIGVISINARNMGKMIDDLLTLSHLGRKDISLVDIDMTKLARSVCHELKTALFPDRAMEISVKPLPSARLDPTLAKQIFANLISNAMKFTARKEKAVIEIGGYDKDGERVYYVKDNGAGFDMKYADKLFGIFQRVHPQNEFGGTGIGLAIVRSAVVRLGGKVWAQGGVDQGATFYFTLPKGA